MLTLQTQRLILYSLSRELLELALNDVEGLAVELNIQVSTDVFSEESRQAMMIKISRMDHADLQLHPWYSYFLLVRAEDRMALGVCGFKGAPSLFGSVELGYALQETYRNQGYMTEAVRALVEWAFTHESCRRVTAETLSENYASQHVLTKSGLEMERSSGNMLYWKVDKNHVE